MSSEDETTESKSSIKKKQLFELKQFEKTKEQMLKSAGKDKTKKEQVDKEIKKLETELLQKHRKQMEAFEKLEEIPKVDQEAPKEPSKEEIERLKKKEKSKKKTEKKKQKEEDVRKKSEDILKNGLTERQKELNLIQKQLNSLGLTVKTIPSDGHCLYRSIADQEFPEVKEGHMELRRLVAKEFRSNPDEYLPYLESSNGDMLNEKEFEDYCVKVEQTPIWGGQVELKSLVTILKKQINIYTANAPVLMMGEEYQNHGTINLSFHRFFYSLGEHYNSIRKEEITEE